VHEITFKSKAKEVNGRDMKGDKVRGLMLSIYRLIEYLSMVVVQEFMLA